MVKNFVNLPWAAAKKGCPPWCALVKKLKGDTNASILDGVKIVQI
jgi:hypothetical protein